MSQNTYKTRYTPEKRDWQEFRQIICAAAHMKEVAEEPLPLSQASHLSFSTIFSLFFRGRPREAETYIFQGCENGVFGKRCFCPLPKTGGFDEKWRK